MSNNKILNNINKFVGKTTSPNYKIYIILNDILDDTRFNVQIKQIKKRWFCVECGEDMGNNPRQLCMKTYCCNN